MVYRQTARIKAHLLDRNRRILEAAKSCIALHGLSGTRIRHIVSEAKCSTGAFYEALGSKEAAVHALGDEIFAELDSALEKLWKKERQGRKAFDRGLQLVFEIWGSDRERAIVLLGEAGGPEGTKTYSKVIGGLVQFTAEQIERGIKYGLLRLVDPRLAAWCVVGTITLQVARWAIVGEITHAQLIDESPRIAELLWAMLGAHPTSGENP